MARVKTQKAGIETKEEFFAKVNNVAQLAVEIRKLEADRDKELQEVRERHEARIQAKTDLRDNLTASCRLLRPTLRALWARSRILFLARQVRFCAVC